MIAFIDEDSDDIWFPPQDEADENGILAVGGDLRIERLILAYNMGIFPWYNPDELPMWFCPDPRFVLYPDKIRISDSMKSILKKNTFQVTYNQCFKEVVEWCGKITRNYGPGTWISQEIIHSYTRLHEMGRAMSVEVWQNEELVGGLYGVIIGNIFVGESMFAKVSNASKAGFITFVNEFKSKGLSLVDCQVHTPHLESLGGENMERKIYLERVTNAINQPNFAKEYF